ncbi:MAG: DNA topoisomerase IB [Pseudonocardiaceae bacterium]
MLEHLGGDVLLEPGQYRYHDEWRRRCDAEKHDRALGLARRLPRVRQVVAEQFAGRGLSCDRVLAAAIRMLDIGVFRVGGEGYAPGPDDDEGSFGLATVRREHVRLRGGAVEFCYPAKGGAERTIALRDAALHKVVGALLRRRGGGPDLLAYRVGSGWHDVRSEDINARLKQLAGDEFTAKDLRTWNATVLAAVALAEAAADGVPGSKRGRTRLVNAALDEVAEHLGNTRAVAKSSYVDPRVVEWFCAGRTVLPALRRVGTADLSDDAARSRLEQAVLRLLHA